MIRVEGIVPPERKVVRHLREKAMLSRTRLDELACQRKKSCEHFEVQTYPLSAFDRRKLVKYLEVLLTFRMDYPSAMRSFREKHGLSVCRAAKLANVSHAAWDVLECGDHGGIGPTVRVRARVDALLDHYAVAIQCPPEVAEHFRSYMDEVPWVAP